MRSFVDAKKFRRMAKRKRSDDMDLEDDRSVKRRTFKRAARTRASFPRKPAAKKTTTRRKSSGQYGGFFKSAGERVGGFIGKALGSQRIGKWVGGRLGHLVSKITGFGDYEIEGNSIMRGGLSPPEVVNSADRGGFIVRHREYITDINAATAFTNQAFPINPGIKTTFPWLGAVASAFEEWSPRGIVFEFKSMSSDAVLSASTSSSLGTVIMCTQYNPYVPNFENKVEMENYMFANSSKPSLSFIHPVECKKGLNPLDVYFTRTEGNAPGDIRMYDLGEFQIAVQGCQASTGVLGELWCSYEIELMKPKFTSPQAVDHFQLYLPSNVLPLGGEANPVPSSTLEGKVDGTSYLFPPAMMSGKFLFNWVVAGTGTAALTKPVITGTNCVFQRLYTNDTQLQVGTSNTTVASEILINFIVTITGRDAKVTWGTAGVFPPTPRTGDLIVTQISSELIT